VPTEWGFIRGRDWENSTKAVWGWPLSVSIAYAQGMNPRLRAVCDLIVSDVRENSGRHEYDGVVGDLSPSAVAAGLARLGGAPLDDPVEEAHLAAFEERTRVEFGEAELHRRSPMALLAELDLSCYERAYAPEAERAEARRRHLAAWPEAVDAGLASLDQVSAPVAGALLPAVEGLTAAVDGDGPAERAARGAHARFVERVRSAATTGDPDPALGGQLLARLLGAGEVVEVDLGRLEEAADAERDRLRVQLDEACARIAPGRPTGEVITMLLADHPGADGVIDQARALVDETIAFTREHDLVPGLDGACEVVHAPPSRRWATAMMSWAAPYEADAPSLYYITPPDPAWPDSEREAWLEVFNHATLPAITVHEVAPGHFAHGRALRRAEGDVRRTLQSLAFVEGWAHYAEDLCVEEGFRGDDPRFRAGVALEALQRVTRLAVSLGLHTRTMTLADAVGRFQSDAYLRGVAARAEANRATYDPTYGRYTWGKLEILRLRDQARSSWGAGYSHPRFHAALLALGAPPLGLMRAALRNGQPHAREGDEAGAQGQA
jgi:uncharacterized protein DUF885